MNVKRASAGDGATKDRAPGRNEAAGPDSATEGGIREQLRNLTLRQQRFERYLSRQLHVDAAGLAVMDHLVTVGPATPTELAHRLGASTAATTLVIDRLVAGGHVARHPHPTDRRKVIVTPAENWESMAFEHVAPIIQGVSEAADALSARDREVVAAFLAKVINAYDNATKP